MNSGFRRLLHIRELLEELAGAELQKKNADLRRLEEGAEQNRREAAALRSEALRQNRNEAASDAWLGIADAEILTWRSRRLSAAAQEAGEEAAAARLAMMARRMERLQAETLVAEDERAEQQERKRREQSRLDDWFQSTPGTRRSFE